MGKTKAMKLLPNQRIQPTPPAAARLMRVP